MANNLAKRTIKYILFTFPCNTFRLHNYTRAVKVSIVVELKRLLKYCSKFRFKDILTNLSIIFFFFTYNSRPKTQQEGKSRETENNFFHGMILKTVTPPNKKIVFKI